MAEQRILLPLVGRQDKVSVDYSRRPRDKASLLVSVGVDDP